ncbi:MAG: DUF3604 domain-containing protein [Deltaproteobacteria bacterium]|nr:DUF3604 domain-containing protein [Deltaproteobacteria bacterium]
MLGAAACGSYQPTGTPTDKPLGEAATGKRVFDQAQARNKLVVESTEAAKAAAEDDDTSTPLSAAERQANMNFAFAAKQILFGDLHVHTTYSIDAFFLALPMIQGEGVRPPSDACDYARYCSQLDFFSLNDHSENLTPQLWKQTKEAIRQCNAVAQDPNNPDLVAFLGWEWSQVGLTPEEHYGHKNVILKDTAEDKVPTRAINAQNQTTAASIKAKTSTSQMLQMLSADKDSAGMLIDLGYLQRQVAGTPVCPDGVDVHELPDTCMETASTPEVLFEKLNQWGYDSLVIPHGTTWGIYTPPGTTIDKQLTPTMHDPSRQRLIEVYSGHGNSEEYRDFTSVEFGPDGEKICPAPTKDYEPCCWRAGEIIRSRCEDPASEDCEKVVVQARQDFLNGGVSGFYTVPGMETGDWKDCDQCRDCYLPAFSYRPGNSVQAALAAGYTEGDDQDPLRFRFGLIASSDNHSARPGTGYKDYDRVHNTDGRGPKDKEIRDTLRPTMEPEPRSYPYEEIRDRWRGPASLPPWDIERQTSFYMTGGLVAVHSAGRSRDAIWDALERREVYGTSGDRILLWFDYLDKEGATGPMGSEVRTNDAPRFRVRAVGSFEQKPGCPEFSTAALTSERLDHLCGGECFNPGDKRRKITRVEVVRIRPRNSADEKLGDLIEDPWKVVACEDDGAGCEVTFTDPEYPTLGREALYYVRAIQEPTMAINADTLRCKYNDAGECVEMEPCYGDYRTPASDDCLAETEERAWSSPIWVRPR